MKALLQKSCKECTKSSIQTYFYNIKALAKVGGHSTIPAHSRWINDALLRKLKKLPLMRFKNLTIAAVKALKAYGKTDGTKREKWNKEMSSATERYAKQRNKQERTEREAKNWPKGGYAAIGKLADDLHEEVAPILRKAPAKITLAELWRLARWFIVTFYSKHALRGDLGDVQIRKKGQNYIEKRGKGWHMHIGDHKTVRAHGAIELKLDPKVSTALDQYMPYVRAKTKHGYLISTKRTGTRMSRKDMMLLLRRTTEDRLGKRIGVQLIRVMKTTAKFKSIDEAAKLRSELAHGPQMQWKYVSRA